MTDDEESMGDMWREIKKAGQEKRASNRESSPALLAEKGIKFELKNDGAHLIVSHKEKVIDFWPGTGKWNVRKSRDGGYGVFRMLKYLEIPK